MRYPGKTRVRQPRHRALLPLAFLGVLMYMASGCSSKPKYPKCKSSKDCKAGEHCVAQQCKQCGLDSHCEPGQVCRDNRCITETDACTSDEDCGDRACINGVCQNCTKDADCGPHGKCNNGKCTRPTKCSEPEDCEDDEDCIDGRCQRPWKTEPPKGLSCSLATVFFQFDEAAITPETREILNRNAECLRKASGRGIALVGHTDPRGTEEYNIALSERRARSVANYLSRLGIDADRLSVVPKGETEASGVDDSGWGRDRRVQFQWK